jgi:hypothetical protein
MLEKGWTHYQHYTPTTKSSRKRKRNRRSPTTIIISKTTDLMEIWQALTGRGLSNRRLTGRHFGKSTYVSKDTSGKVPMFPKTFRTLCLCFQRHFGPCRKALSTVPPKQPRCLCRHQEDIWSRWRFSNESSYRELMVDLRIATKSQVGVDAITVAKAFLTAIANIPFCSPTDDDTTKAIHEKGILFWAAIRLAASLVKRLGGRISTPGHQSTLVCLYLPRPYPNDFLPSKRKVLLSNIVYCFGL